MVFFRRRGRPNQKQRVTKSVDLYCTRVVSTSSLATDSAVQSAVTFPLNRGAYSTDFASSAIYSNSQTVIGRVYYGFDFSSIPEDATNIRLTMVVGGKAENPSQSEHTFSMQMYYQLTSGYSPVGSMVAIDVSTYIRAQIKDISVSDVMSTSGKTERETLDGMCCVFRVGYYGGYITGATLTVTYDVYE